MRTQNQESVKQGIPLDQLGNEIKKISDTMRKLGNGLVTRKLVVALIHDDTRILKRDINTVLDSLEELERKYLKPKGKKQ